jgi:mannose-1-phosphate guanylyltransferase
VSNFRVVPADFGWSDVGSWSAMEDVLAPGDAGVAHADALVGVRSARNIAWAPGRLVALLGVEDLVVVDTGDVLMVARREDAQSVRDLLAEVERRGLGRYS